MTESRKLEIALLSLRLTIGAFFLVWALQKVLLPEASRRVVETFYFSSPSELFLVATGLVQVAIVLAFMAGALRFWTTGLLLVMHTVSVASTVERLINPYESPNALFWAAVPLLAALFALFLLRESDRLLSIDARRAARSGSAAQRQA